MTLIETFRNETADDEDFRATPSSDQSDAQNMLYFPTGLGFGKLKALPLAKDVEYPERDLADKLVSPRSLPRAHMTGPHPRRVPGLLTRPPPGRCLFRTRSFPSSCARSTFLFDALYATDGQRRRWGEARIRRRRFCSIRMCGPILGRFTNQSAESHGLARHGNDFLRKARLPHGYFFFG